jgi:hypothetical protein
VEVKHVTSASAWLSAVDGAVAMSGTAIPAFAPALSFLRRIGDLESVSRVTSMNGTEGMVATKLYPKDLFTVFANRREPFLLLRKGQNGVESFLKGLDSVA